MRWKIVFFFFFILILSIFFPIFLLLYYQYLSVAAPIKANIVIDVKKTIGPVPDRWKALAQGGEEKGVRMLDNIISQIAALYPKYIRIDHIYDFYDVVSRGQAGSLTFNWDRLDETVCDIYRTGAKPFFVLGYMPSVLSGDGSPITSPANWNEWAFTVQNTVEHYSGVNSRLCGQVTGPLLTDIYYEVWNEPDHESFGKWSIYSGNKDYSTLYFYSSLGARRATKVNNFFLGGPATTALYKNWTTVLLDNVIAGNLKFDFFSWHHYSKQTSDFGPQISQLNTWLSDEKYSQFRSLPKIISEWGYDSDLNSISDTSIGAAHTIASIRNFFEQNIEAAFLFEIKDGPSKSWGILTREGVEKPRYKALQFLNQLEGTELFIDGEGSHVTALSSISGDTIRIVLVNYDPRNLNNELVPVKFTNLAAGKYLITVTYLNGRRIPMSRIQVADGELSHRIIMPPNMVAAVELKKEP